VKPTWRCGNCNSTYREPAERCPRCDGPELVQDEVDEAQGESGAPPEGVPVAPPQRPIRGAPKADHVAYATLVHGLTARWWDEHYAKPDLIDVLDRLETGEAIMGEDSVIDAAPMG
jgi:hypothetical protein